MKKLDFVALLLTPADVLCQTPAKESDTLQSLLLEVHQLRVDLEAMTVASQRVQIALYALQMQDGAVARAAQRLDSARNTCRAKEEEWRHFATELSAVEAEIAAGTGDVARAKLLQERLVQVKNALDARMTDVRNCEAGEAEASNQYRNDQAKMADLQERIDRLDKRLGPPGTAGK